MAEQVTPQVVLDYWIGAAASDAAAAAEKNTLWFTKSFETDQYIAETFVPLLADLADGLAYDWADQGPRSRLAAIIALDQFSRNAFRGLAGAFKQDRLALGLTKEGLMIGADSSLLEMERIFFYLPLEHSERLADQELCVSLCEKLLADAREPFKPLCQSFLQYAIAHRDVIERFGRFPHRNEILNRNSTEKEQAYLAEAGSGF